MPGILLALSHVARQSSVTVTSVHPSPPVTLGLGYSAIPISITITGRYTAISSFEHLLGRPSVCGPSTTSSSRKAVRQRLDLTRAAVRSINRNRIGHNGRPGKAAVDAA